MGSRSATYVSTVTRTNSVGDYSSVAADKSSVTKLSNVILEGTGNELNLQLMDNGAIAQAFEQSQRAIDEMSQVAHNAIELADEVQEHSITEGAKLAAGQAAAITKDLVNLGMVLLGSAVVIYYLKR